MVRRATFGGQRAVPLPKRCVKCGRQATVLLERTFSWHEPWIYLLLLSGVVPYLILVLVLRKQIQIDVPLCADHDTSRQRALVVAWLIALAGVSALPFLPVGAGILTLVLAISAAAAVGLALGTTLRPARIDDQLATFRGCGEEFLRRL